MTARDEPGIALIAGGVGIAPLLGILRDLVANNDPRPTLLIYGNRTAGQIAYADELDAIAFNHGTRIVHVLSEPPDGWQGETGLINRGLIQRVFDQPGMKDWLYVMCGPPAMMDGVDEALIAKGVPLRQIHSERFKYD